MRDFNTSPPPRSHQYHSFSTAVYGLQFCWPPTVCRLPIQGLVDPGGEKDWSPRGEDQAATRRRGVETHLTSRPDKNLHTQHILFVQRCCLLNVWYEQPLGTGKSQITNHKSQHRSPPPEPELGERSLTCSQQRGWGRRATTHLIRRAVLHACIPHVREMQGALCEENELYASIPIPNAYPSPMLAIPCVCRRPRVSGFCFAGTATPVTAAGFWDFANWQLLIVNCQLSRDAEMHSCTGRAMSCLLHCKRYLARRKVSTLFQINAQSLVSR